MDLGDRHDQFEPWISDSIDQFLAAREVAFRQEPVTARRRAGRMAEQHAELLVKITGAAEGVGDGMSEAVKVRRAISLDADPLKVAPKEP